MKFKSLAELVRYLLDNGDWYYTAIELGGTPLSGQELRVEAERLMAEHDALRVTLGARQ